MGLPPPPSPRDPSGHSYCCLPQEQMEKRRAQDCGNSLASSEGQLGISRTWVQDEVPVPCYG